MMGSCFNLRTIAKLIVFEHCGDTNFDEFELATQNDEKNVSKEELCQDIAHHETEVLRDRNPRDNRLQSCV